MVSWWQILTCPQRPDREPYPTNLYYSTVDYSICVYGTLVAMFVSLGRYITLHRYSVMVADSDISTETQIGSYTLPPYTVVQ